jgi:hypothetical protein
MRILLSNLSFMLAAASLPAQADECQDIAKVINQSSRAALQKSNDDPKLAQESTQEIFKQCRKFVELKCTQWNWLGTERSIRSFCYEAILTDDRNKKRAGDELLEYSKKLSPASGKQNAAPDTQSAK